MSQNTYQDAWEYVRLIRMRTGTPKRKLFYTAKASSMFSKRRRRRELQRTRAWRFRAGAQSEG